MTTQPIDTAAHSARTGLIQGASAYALWGLLPLFFMLVKIVDAGEVVGSRVAWSLLLLLGLTVALRRRARLWLALSDMRTLRLLMASAAMISINWTIYIWAVQNHHVLEASLGYFINPLVNVLLGVVVLHERLSKPQLAAVMLAGLGVLVLAVQSGGALWISFGLAVSFGLYGLVRKIAPVESLEGLTVETLLLTPIAIGYMVWLSLHGGLSFGTDAGTTALLIASGGITAVPLLLFAAAARRLRYSTLALLQYLAPTLQFALAITLFGEKLTTAHAICFALIWSGLAVFVLGSIRRPRPTTV